MATIDLRCVEPHVTLAKGVRAKDLRLSGADSEKAFVHCLDPCGMTGGGTGRFAITTVEESEPSTSSKPDKATEPHSIAVVCKSIKSSTADHPQ